MKRKPVAYDADCPACGATVKLRGERLDYHGWSNGCDNTEPREQDRPGWLAARLAERRGKNP